MKVGCNFFYFEQLIFIKYFDRVKFRVKSGIKVVAGVTLESHRDPKHYLKKNFMFLKSFKPKT